MGWQLQKPHYTCIPERWLSRPPPPRKLRRWQKAVGLYRHKQIFLKGFSGGGPEMHSYFDKTQWIKRIIRSWHILNLSGTSSFQELSLKEHRKEGHVQDSSCCIPGTLAELQSCLLVRARFPGHPRNIRQEEVCNVLSHLISPGSWGGGDLALFAGEGTETQRGLVIQYKGHRAFT